MNRRPRFWTPERVEILRQRTAEGASCKQIGTELGVTVAAVWAVRARVKGTGMSQTERRALEMWNAGQHTYRQIGEAVGITRGSVGRICAEARARGDFVLDVAPAIAAQRSLARQIELYPERYQAAIARQTASMRGG